MPVPVSTARSLLLALSFLVKFDLHALASKTGTQRESKPRTPRVRSELRRSRRRKPLRVPGSRVPRQTACETHIFIHTYILMLQCHAFPHINRTNPSLEDVIPAGTFGKGRNHLTVSWGRARSATDDVILEQSLLLSLLSLSVVLLEAGLVLFFAWLCCVRQEVEGLGVTTRLRARARRRGGARGRDRAWAVARRSVTGRAAFRVEISSSLGEF